MEHIKWFLAVSLGDKAQVVRLLLWLVPLSIRSLSWVSAALVRTRTRLVRVVPTCSLSQGIIRVIKIVGRVLIGNLSNLWDYNRLLSLDRKQL
jgi:hypothetical protein